jgi:hypothetical protein
MYFHFNVILKVKRNLPNTFFLHVDLQTLFESAGLALISSGHIHGARAVLFANVVQVPEVKHEIVIIKVIVEHVGSCP